MNIGRVRDNSAKGTSLYNEHTLYNQNTLYLGGQVVSGIYPQIQRTGAILSSNQSIVDTKTQNGLIDSISPSNYLIDDTVPNNYSAKDL